MRAKILALFLLCSVTLCAQDIIVQNNGNTILSKVIEIGSTEVKYKKFSNLNGPTYTIAKAEILVINYENGEKESFTNAQSPSSVVKTNNIGKRMLSDNELLKVDKNLRITNENVKKLRRNAVIVGVIGLGVGTALILKENAESGYWINDGAIFGLGAIIGGACIVGSATYACVNLVKANKMQKELYSYAHSTPIFQENIVFSNGNTLSAGIDMIKGKNFDYTPGLGLRYTF